MSAFGTLHGKGNRAAGANRVEPQFVAAMAGLQYYVRVIDAAQAVAIPADQKILHILPQEYIIDNQEGIKEPVGMSSSCRWAGRVSPSEQA